MCSDFSATMFEIYLKKHEYKNFDVIIIPAQSKQVINPKIISNISAGNIDE